MHDPLERFRNPQGGIRLIGGLNAEQGAEYDRIRAAGDVPALTVDGTVANLSHAQRIVILKPRSAGASRLAAASILRVE
jgi:hypothetical protein